MGKVSCFSTLTNLQDKSKWTPCRLNNQLHKCSSWCEAAMQYNGLVTAGATSLCLTLQAHYCIILLCNTVRGPAFSKSEVSAAVGEIVFRDLPQVKKRIWKLGPNGRIPFGCK